MLDHSSFVRLATGTKACYEWGVPTLDDIKIGLARENRYCGATLYPWPVLLHTFVGMHFVPDYLRAHFLFHDAPEVIGGDRPRPVKPRWMSEQEERVYIRILDAHGLHHPNEQEIKLLKHADDCAFLGELHTLAPPGLDEDYPDLARVPDAERLVCHYLKTFPPEDLALRDGRATRYFTHLYHDSMRLYREANTFAYA